MADILDLQGGAPEETPGTEKGSYVSWRNLCINSYVSFSLCFVK